MFLFVDFFLIHGFIIEFSSSNLSGWIAMWENMYRLHLLGLEKFLLNRKPSPLSGEQTVYLAGMIARELDLEYKRQAEKFLVQDPEEIDRAVCLHEPYIGQNAPIVTLCKINAERQTIEIACRRHSYALHLELPETVQTRSLPRIENPVPILWHRFCVCVLCGKRDGCGDFCFFPPSFGHGGIFGGGVSGFSQRTAVGREHSFGIVAETPDSGEGDSQ